MPVLELSIPTLVDLFSCCSSFMLGLLFLFNKSNNKRANTYLGLFLLSLSVEVLAVLSESLIGESFFMLQSSLFTIPFLLLYTFQTINYKIQWYYVMLFLPGVLLNLFAFKTLHSPIFQPFEYLFNGILLVNILVVLKAHKQALDNFYSELENKTLKWIKIIIYIFIAFHLLWIFEDIIGFSNEIYGAYCAGLSTVATFFMVLWIGHYGFSQQEIFRTKLFQPHNWPKQGDANSKEFIALNTKVDESLFKELQQKIVSEKLFCDPKLNLRSLSSLLEIPEKELSRLINQQTNSNFYHFINRFRVNEFKELLQSSKAQQFSLLGLANEAGFNSKSTFYAAFKALEGITPKAYEDSLKESD